MSLKQFKGDAKPASNHMTKLGMDVMNYTQNGPNTHLDSSKTRLLCNMWGDKDA
jgi:hypothetical protein